MNTDEGGAAAPSPSPWRMLRHRRWGHEERRLLAVCASGENEARVWGYDHNVVFVRPEKKADHRIGSDGHKFLVASAGPAGEE